MKNTSLISICLASALAAPVASANDDAVDVYGKINVSLQHNDNGSTSETELESNNSRFGLKGKVSLDHGLEAFYLLEWQVDVADIGGSDNIKSRNQYVGIRGGFGEIMAGRRDTVLKSSQGKIDVFSDYEGDIKALFEGENRTSDTLTYFTPKFGQFRGGVSYILSEDEAVDDGVSLSLTYGDAGLKSSDFYLAAAVDSEVDGYDVVRFSGSTKLNTTTLGFMYQVQEAVENAPDADGFVVSLAHPVNKFTFKAQVQTLDFIGTDSVSFAGGVDYKLGAQTKAFAWYTGRSLETIVLDQQFNSTISDVDQNYFAVGIEHNF
ncbi:Outer membrane protein (porin) [Pseudidiomarina planktonica]|uniref:Outer membrane protein (Porin) n=1 Tax=Pseudidiomarina planktonica TaxID=1323738 RepID=A0A1Y6G294_9GAMM|nr:porin [Pseudidiomarina planktonica]RUO63329.1 porin [Pseudidiomarina planktonica]SMQ80449.1 Outer membrane protein (porin) [Pseudidiomarina planktonica]